jgi:hypothetical protein
MHRFVVLALLIAFAPAARADVLTVDDDGPADFADLPAAVAAAAPGDLLFVAPGSYSGFTLDGLPLSLVPSEADEPELNVLITGPVRVRNLPAGQTVSFTGLRITGIATWPALAGHGVSIEDCAGSVRIAHSDIRGIGQQGGPPVNHAGVNVTGSHDVVLVDTAVEGSFGSLSSPQCASGGAGVLVGHGALTAWDCDIEGGRGGGVEYSPDLPGDGGPGVQLLAGSFVAQGGSIRGGSGPFSDSGLSAGGDGLEADGASVVRLRLTPVHGGEGGYLWQGLVPVQGPDGAPFDVAVPVQQIPGVPTLLSSTAPAVMPGTDFRILSTGSGLLLVGLEGANAWLPGWSAPLHVVGGVLVPVASFPLVITMPALPAAFPGADLHLQLARSTHELSAPACVRLELSLP